MILVTGGAGYIGSHIARQLSEAGHDFLIYDNLSTGSQKTLLHNEKLVIADLADQKTLEAIFQQYVFTTVIHLAASVSIEESFINPLHYYNNNVTNTQNLLQLCVKYAIKNFILSSSATVYAAQELKPLAENHATAPENPYGNSKLMSEWLVQDITRAHNINYIILRYFNVAGADPQTRMGQYNKKATHLIRKACQTALGVLDYLPVYGTDYPTPDGTAVRDYIHVEDLANIHLAAIQYLQHNNASLILNAGYNCGYSVHEIISATKAVTGVNLKTEAHSRRTGDPIMLVAKNQQLQQHFNWRPQYNCLEKIIEDAWRWESKLWGRA